MGDGRAKEGAGAIYPYFKTTKLCDSAAPFSAAARDALMKNPGWPREDIPLTTDPSRQPTSESSKALIEWGGEIAASGRRGSDLSAVSAAITALPPAELPAYLQKQAPLLFEENPNGSLWFFEVRKCPAWYYLGPCWSGTRSRGGAWGSAFGSLPSILAAASFALPVSPSCTVSPIFSSMWLMPAPAYRSA